MATPQINLSDGDGGAEITLALPCLSPTPEVSEAHEPTEDKPAAATQPAPAIEVSEKDKRQRHFVVKEIVETERSYLSTLDVVCKSMRQGMLDGCEDEPEFTEEVVNALFSNINDLREVHLRIVDDLSASVGSDYDACSELGKVYMKHTSDLKEHYTIYGSTHERAQSMIVELIRREPFKSYFTNILSERGQMASDANIQSYLLCPVQRICKYPLLFRELCKHTWAHHPDHASAKSAYAAMQVVCSVINEAKRRAEKLEAVHDWQQGVDNFEGSNLVDTCNEMVLKGPLLKISSGNCQERWFFLFDGVLVYCKKTGDKARNPRRVRSSSTGSAPVLGFAFKGRLALETMEVQNLEDGTSDQLTCGSKVTNAWRLQNVTKKKWFVCMASSDKEKQQWMETLLIEREKRRMVALNQLQETYLLLSAKARNYCKIMQQSKILKDRKVKKATHHQSFYGSDLIQIIMEGGDLSAINQAHELALEFMAHDIVDKVDKKVGEVEKQQETFETKELYTFKDKKSSQQEHSEYKAVQLYSRIHLMFSPIVKDNKALLSSTKSCFSGKDLIDFLIAHGDFSARGEAQQFGQHLFSMGFVQHVDDKHHFKDAELWYRFLFDSDKEGTAKKQEFFCSDTSTSRTVHLVGGDNVGISFDPDDLPTILKVKAGSDAEAQGIKAGMKISHINYVQTAGLQLDQINGLMRAKKILSICVSDKEFMKVEVTADDGKGFGFKIAGSAPCTIAEVTPGSSAQSSGIYRNLGIVAVNGQDCSQAAHSLVADLMRKGSGSLGEEVNEQPTPSADTKSENGVKPSSSVKSFVNISALNESVITMETSTDLSSNMGSQPVLLNLQPPSIEYSAFYQYDTVGDGEVSMRESLLDAQFSYSVPASLFHCLLVEDREILSHVEMVSKSLADGQVTIPTSSQFEGSLSSYIDKMRSQCSSYEAMVKVLSTGRCQQHKTILDNKRWEQVAAPLNCNVHELEVCTKVTLATGGLATPASTSAVSDEEDDREDDFHQSSRVFYHIVTAGTPAAVEVCRAEDPDKASYGLKSLMDTQGQASSYRKWFHLNLKVMSELYDAQLQVKKAFDGDGTHCAFSPSVSSFNDTLGAHDGDSDGPLIYRADSMSSLTSSAGDGSATNQAAVVSISSFLNKADKFCDTLREKSVNSAVGVVYSPSQRESTSSLLSGKGARPSAAPKRTLSINSRGRSPSISAPSAGPGQKEQPIVFRERRNTIRSQRGGYLELAEAQTLTTINKLQSGKKNAGRNLIQQIAELKHLNARNPAEEGVMRLIDEIISGISNINNEVCRCLLHAMIMEEDLGVVQRRDIVFSQALAIILSGFSRRLHAAINGVVNCANEWGLQTSQNSLQWLNQIVACGLLVQFDVWAEPHMADEVAMLEDAAVAIEDLRQLDLRIKCCSPDGGLSARRHGNVAIHGRRGHIQAELFLDTQSYKKLPAIYRNTPAIQVKSCLFTSAMTDLDVLTNESKRGIAGQTLQANLNSASVDYLSDYSATYRTFLLDTSRTEMSRAAKMVEIDKSLNRLQAIDQAIIALQHSLRHNLDRTSRYNSCSINLQANDIVNRCGGLRVACSERGVNRVAMAVSAETAMILMRAHQLPPRSFIPALSVLRSQGCGMSNLHKNRQGDHYSMVNIPPSLYRPPKSIFRITGASLGPMEAPRAAKRPQKGRSFFAKASMRLVGSRTRKPHMGTLVAQVSKQ